MSDYDNDYDNDFDYDGDTDTDFDSSGENGGSTSATDAVAELLMGNESALDNTTGENNANESGKSFITRRDDDFEAPQREEAPANTPMPQNDAAQNYQQAHNVAQQSLNAINELDKMMNGGIIDQEQAVALAQEHMNALSIAKVNMLQAENDNLRRSAWIESAHAQLNAEMGEEWNDPVKRKAIQTKGVDMLRAEGLTDDEIRSIDDPRAMKVVYRAIKTAEENKRLALQVAKLKAERNSHNRELKREARHAGRSRENTKTSNDSIANLLIKGGFVK